MTGSIKFSIQDQPNFSSMISPNHDHRTAEITGSNISIYSHKRGNIHKFSYQLFIKNTTNMC